MTPAHKKFRAAQKAFDAAKTRLESLRKLRDAASEEWELEVQKERGVAGPMNAVMAEPAQPPFRYVGSAPVMSLADNGLATPADDRDCGVVRYNYK